MAHLRSLALAVLAILTLAPLVNAGDPATPEVVDARGDGGLCDPLDGTTCIPAQANQPFLDVQNGWVEAVGDDIVFHMTVGEAPPVAGVGAGTTVPEIPMVGGGFCVNQGAWLRYSFSFQGLTPSGQPSAPLEPDGSGAEITSASVNAQLDCDNAAAGPDALGFAFFRSWSFEDATLGPLESSEPISGSLVGSEFTFILPRNDTLLNIPLGNAGAGYSLGNLQIGSEANALVAVLIFSFGSDQGPDAGFGAPFALPAAAPAAPPTVYHEVATPTFTLASSVAETTSRTEVYNWTNSAASLDLAYSVASPAGSAHVLVKDSAGAEVLNETLVGDAERSLAVANAKTGAWQVTVTYADFVGDLELGIAAAAPPPAPSSTAPAPPPEPVIDGSVNDQATGGFPPVDEEKGTPATGLVFLAAGLLVAVLAARRRLA